MVVKIEIRGLNKINKRLLNLSKKLTIALSKDSEMFIRDVARDAKRYAPRDTGYIKDSIRVLKTKTKGKIRQWKLHVGSEHAIFQEEGFKPHWVYIQNSAKLEPGFYYVKKNTPFVRPALEKNLSKFSQKLNATTRREIKK